MATGLEIAIKLLENGASPDEVFVGIGENLPDTLGFDELSVEDKLNAGRIWWDRHSAELKQTVCRLVTSRDVVNVVTKDLVQAVFVAIGAKYGIGIAAYAAAFGIRKAAEGWCGDNSNVEHR